MLLLFHVFNHANFNHGVPPGGSALFNPLASFVAFTRNSVEGDVHDDDVPAAHGGECLLAASGPLRGDDDGLRDLAAEQAHGGVSARVRSSRPWPAGRERET
jgi:hypothetical protein